MLKLSFYGDDFTGSTDVMESLTMNGIPTALFLEAPSFEEVESFRLKNVRCTDDGKLMAFGVAGISRTLNCEQMDLELPSIFDKISKIKTEYFHYKVCSTFDSSPQIGNIGHAVSIAQKYFPSLFVPVIVGIPLLNRFCVFGNLFAKVGKTTYRLDRHPTMSQHPITPMFEADLCEHLKKQTNEVVHLIDVLQLDNEDFDEMQFNNIILKGGFILFDVLQSNHLTKIGSLIGKKKSKGTQLLVGSSGVDYALTSYWQQTTSIESGKLPKCIEKASRYMVVAGSCSPKTAEQIQYGLKQGYHPVQINTINLIKNRALEIERCTILCLSNLSKKQVPLVHLAIGPEDPVIEETNKLYARVSKKESLGHFLGSAQGEILKNIIDQTGKLRITVAGGDTSGFVSKSLGIYALEILVPIAPGAPLCLAHANNSTYDGLEISLKGGQNGNDAFFEYVRNGGVE